jgi:hypothetical protein
MKSSPLNNITITDRILLTRGRTDQNITLTRGRTDQNITITGGRTNQDIVLEVYKCMAKLAAAISTLYSLLVPVK